MRQERPVIISPVFVEMSERSWKSLKGDIAFGKKKEDEVKPILEEKFNCELQQGSKYATIDFFNQDKSIYIELKSRRNTYNKYPTTLLTSNKIKKIQDNTTTEYYFVFNFTDGLYYIKYDKTVFDEIECGTFQRFHRQDKDEKPVEHYYIPIEKLTPLSDFIRI